MTEKVLNEAVSGYLRREEQWQEAFYALRFILLDCGLTEEIKWGKPCYTFNGSNIAVMQGFKRYCALLFVKGALLNDAHGMLIRQTKNVQAARQLRFVTVSQITENQGAIRDYINEAVAVQKAGLQIPMKKTEDLPVPQEFQDRLNGLPELKTAFAALTPGRQRGYLHYFAQPKQAKTRDARIEKHLQRILAGKGLND